VLPYIFASALNGALRAGYSLRFIGNNQTIVEWTCSILNFLIDRLNCNMIFGKNVFCLRFQDEVKCYLRIKVVD